MIPPPAYKTTLESKMTCVYLLRSLTRKTLYLGWTTNLERRLRQHNTGQTAYTKGKGPWELIAYEVYESSEKAKEREKKLKRNSRMYSLFKKKMLARHAFGVPRQVVG